MGNRNAKPPKPVEDKLKTLSEYLEYKYKVNLSFKRREEEVHDLTEAVIEMVHEIINEIGKMDSRFEISKIRFVGSMMEGTRNFEPHEFDFLVVIKSLSFRNDISLIRECKDSKGNVKKGCVHIKINANHNSNISETWKDMIKNGALVSNKSVFFQIDGVREKFKDVLERAVGKLKNRKFEIEKETGGLTLCSSEVQNHGPACLCMFQWTSSDTPRNYTKSLCISVDITPAIAFENIENLIDEDEVGNEMYYNLLKNTGDFMAISCGKKTCADGLCFRLTFTNTELALIHRLSVHHRKCYRILKYLFTGVDPTFTAYLLFHSYALKTFVLKHVTEQSCVEGADGSLAKCVMAIVDEIEKCLNTSVKHWTCFEMSLPCTFLPTANIYDRELDSGILKNNQKAMKTLKNSLEKIADIDLADTEEEKIKQFQKLNVAIVYVMPPQVQPVSYQIPYNSLHSSRNRMLMRSMRH